MTPVQTCAAAALPPQTKPAIQPQHEKKSSDGGGSLGNSGNGGGTYHPFVEGLLKTLPPADGEWKAESRRKWLQAAANVFDLIYTDESTPAKTVVITLKASDE